MASLEAPRANLRGAPWGPLGQRLPAPPRWRILLSSCRIYSRISDQLSACNASYATDLGLVNQQSPTTTVSRSVAAEREEAKAILSLFLRRQGMRSALAARVVNNLDGFIKHLVLKLQSTYKSQYRKGGELSTPEISISRGAF